MVTRYKAFGERYGLNSNNCQLVVILKVLLSNPTNLYGVFRVPNLSELAKSVTISLSNFCKTFRKTEFSNRAAISRYFSLRNMRKL